MFSKIIKQFKVKAFLFNKLVLYPTFLKIVFFRFNINNFPLTNKKILGMIMLSLCFLSSVFIMDNSLFMASLITKEIYENENNEDFVNKATFLAGPLSNSPLYHLNKKLKSATPQDEALLLFAKTIKSTHKNLSLSNNIYNDFLQSLNQLNDNDKKQTLEVITQRSRYIPIESEEFIYAFKIDVLLDNEYFWVNELKLLTLNNDNKILVNQKAEIIFSCLSDKYQNTTDINQLFFLPMLKEIKNNLLVQLKDGENLHGSAYEWQKDNFIWQSL